MEIILSLVVVMSVIIFGALISIGNGRQRRAIDSLREQVVKWAVQDLHIKREKLAKEARVTDPIDWLNNVTSKVIGYTIQIEILEVFDSPMVLDCAVTGSTKRALFSPVSPVEIRRLRKERNSRLSQISRINPLFTLPRETDVYEFSILNAGITYDLELQIAWRSLAGYDIGQINQLWLYLFE